jgi:FAD:protein FMN transferase
VTNMASINSAPGIEFRAMNSFITVIANSSLPASYWETAVFRWFAAVERIASRFQEDSELSQLNRSAIAQPISLSPILFQLLHTAWHYAVQTDFLFQPLIGSAIRFLGYNQSFEQLSERGRITRHCSNARHEPVPEPYSPVSDPDALQLNVLDRSVVRNTDVEIDLGGIGKGWSADQAASFLQQDFGLASGLVDAGGDLLVWSSNDPWCIGIQHPRDENLEVLQLWVKNAGIATSNVLYRRWVQGGKACHHILNGHSGLPAGSDVIQATVLAAKASEAEVIAKAMCMLGSTEGIPWVESKFPHAAFVAFTDSGKMLINRKLYDYADKVD